MDARSMVVDHRRLLRAALLGVAAAGAAVVGGFLFGGSHATADDGAGLLDSTLGTTSQVLADTTSVVLDPVVHVASTVVAPVTAPVAPVVQAVAQPVVQPLAPVVQAAVQPVAQAIPNVSSVVTPIASSVDAVVAAVPVVGGLVSAPVGTVTAPIVDVVDDALVGGGDIVEQLPPNPIGGVDPGDGTPAEGPVLDGASDSSDGASSASAEAASAAAAQLGDTRLAGSLAESGAAAQATTDASQTSAEPFFGAIVGGQPGAPVPATPTDVPGAVAPAAAGAATTLVGDATHDLIRSSGAIAGALADDDDLPASVVGDHDSSPD